MKMVKLGKHITVAKSQYGGGLGVHWFRNQYGGRGISMSFILFYVYIHWVRRKSNGSLDYDEDDE